MAEPDAFRPRAVVFDLDGTLVDNMGLHMDAFACFAQDHGLPPLTPAMRRALDGRRNREIFPILFGRELDDAALRAHALEKEASYRELSRGRLAPLRGVERFLGRLEALGVPWAMATSAPAANVPHTLREIGLETRFPRVALSESMPRGKPFPDVFLAAARDLGVDPAACLAFEDSFPGAQSAMAAGMRCCALTTTFEAGAWSEPPRPDWFAADYQDFLDGAGAALFPDPAA
ncbi:MAG TPA: HAD family phosphatase [Planctomycetota bacterium]